MREAARTAQGTYSPFECERKCAVRRRQTASAVVHIARLDMALIEDGTYFVHEAAGEIVACGGWSRRAKLYADGGDAPGDERLLDPAVEPARVRGMFVR